MNNAERNLVSQIARVFGLNRQKILNNWMRHMDMHLGIKDEVENGMFKEIFSGFLDDFINCLSRGDFEAYYEKNRTIAREMAFNDISYDKFILAFHMFEDSYSAILTQIVNDLKVLKYLSALDHLHHSTIVIVSEEYFNIRDNTVTALVKLAELRDSTTGGHLERTQDYLMILAKELQLDHNYIVSLKKAAPLHDIGKVGIRDSILLKPCKLTREEYEEMKKHTVIGAQTIEKVFCERRVCRGYLMMARDIALYHHEKYDGTGYPNGLAGNDIPFAARLFALIDAYDAIISPRPYKEALSHEEAVRRIKADSGKHFDPEVVAAFLRVHEQFREIGRKYDYTRNSNPA